MLHKLVDDGFRIVEITVFESGETSHGDDVAETAHHGNRFEQMFALVAVHDYAALSLQFPCAGIHIQHDGVHAQIHGSLLRAQTCADCC